MLYCQVFSQAGPPLRIDCLTPPPVRHIGMGVARLVPYPKTQQTNLLAFFLQNSIRAERGTGKL